MKKFFLLCLSALLFFHVSAQNKILFDNKKAETAGNADWIPDADVFNLCYNTNPSAGCGNEANAQITPTPAQSGITASTAETYWKGGLSAFAIDCVRKGLTVQSLPYNGQITYNNTANAQDLSNYKVYVVCEPNILFTAAEKTAILNWVYAGGGLLMIADHNVSDRNNDGQDSPHIWNNLMSANPFGITFDYANFSQTTTNVLTTANPITKGTQGTVTSMKFSNGTSMTLSTTANSTVKGAVYKTGVSQGASGAMVAYARYGNGRVVAIGDSSPADDGTGDTNDVLYNGYTGEVSGNHKKLLLNSLLWLSGAASGVVGSGAAEMQDNFVSPLTSTGDVQLYPNPADDAVTFSTSGTAVQQVQVFDMEGKLWLEQQPNADTFDLPTTSLPAGFYLVRYSVGSDWQSRKLVVQH
ncbi:MAG: T9SS type A sorting domain-containing protein [Saprospiraceae bacterium]|nr:T9SS type A sorting domain-containing protein [Saprospiraceae bacterium]